LPLLPVLPGRAKAQFAYAVNNGTVAITGYTGPGGAVVIPSEVNGLPVTGIGGDAFQDSAASSASFFSRQFFSVMLLAIRRSSGKHGGRSLLLHTVMIWTGQDGLKGFCLIGGLSRSDHCTLEMASSIEHPRASFVLTSPSASA
jgi:hypothetical protein